MGPDNRPKEVFGRLGMFGLGKEERAVRELARLIGTAIDSFDNAVVVTAAQTKTEPPAFDDEYLAILLGIADAAGHAANADMDLARKALRAYLSSYPDVDQVLARMVQFSGDPTLLEWQARGGKAMLAAIHARNQAASFAPMLQLAKIYMA